MEKSKTEEMAGLRKKLKLFRDSLKLVWRSSPGWTAANVTVSVLRSFFPLSMVWLLKLLIDNISAVASQGTGETSTRIIYMIAAIAILYFLDEASSDLGNYIRKRQSVDLESYMYGLLHAKAVRLDLINFERPEYFDCLARATREAPWRPDIILNNLVALLQGFLSLLLMAGLILTLKWTIVVLLLLANLPAVLLRMYYAGVLYRVQKEQTPEARKSAYFNWLLTGDRPSREIRLFGLGDYFTALFRKSFGRQKEEEINIIRKRTLIDLASILFKSSAFFITLWYIAAQTIKGTLSIGQMAMFIVAFRQGMIYLRDFFSSVAGLYEDSLFIEDTFEFLNLEEKIRAIEPLHNTDQLQTSLEADQLSFTYPGNKDKTIDNVSFRINKGEIVAIVGPNGAGKSTLVRLLCRLYDPDSGVVSYNDRNIKHYDPAEYKKMFSVVFQDFMLYNLAAGENIRIGNIHQGTDNSKIKAMASVAGIDGLISNLPDGYNTQIGNLFSESRELSWGEWQKLAIARALYRDAPILILDEPSSSLDADTEFEIFSRFREIVKGRTSILISHRFTNVSLADRIIVLDRGSVAESGTHDDLLEKRGIYYEMFIKQSSRFNR